MEQLLIAIFGAALLTLIYRNYRIPITHRWRRRQARTMCEQLCGRDRDQPAALHYARLRAMDPLAFEELLLEAFERRGHRCDPQSSLYRGRRGRWRSHHRWPALADPGEALSRRHQARACA